MSTELHTLQLQQLERIETVLKNMGCHYEIKQPDGVMRVHGAVNKAKRPRLYPHNETRNYYKPFVDDVQPGQVAYVPLDKYPSLYLQSHLCSYLTSKWGRGTYTTHTNTDKKHIEILRTEGI